MGKNSQHGSWQCDNEEREPNPTQLELLLRLEENFRICLELNHMTPLQAGVLIFLRHYAGAKLTDAATLLGLRHPAVSVLVTALEHNGWMPKRRKVKYTRA